jgi:hypothetical protein
MVSLEFAVTMSEGRGSVTYLETGPAEHSPSWRRREVVFGYIPINIDGKHEPSRLFPSYSKTTTPLTDWGGSWQALVFHSTYNA